MAKRLNLKVAKIHGSEQKSEMFFRINTLVKGRVDGGKIQAKDAYGVWQDVEDNLTIKIEHGDGAESIVEFVILPTKTIKCTHIDHKISVKKDFKVGKRYQIEQGRVLGGVAGYVFDENGERWTLYREEIGFSAGGYALFEAKYS